MSKKTNRDHITNLRKDVLSHILSRLPIHDVVRTSALSKDWEFKWTSIYNVDIDSENFSLELRDESNFVSIAEKVLFHVMSIRNCRLVWTSSIENELSRIIMLVSAILRRNVKCLEVDIFNAEDFTLPHNLLTCDTLIKLSLCFGESCSFRVPTNNCFPNLKNLSLERIKIINGISNTDTIVFSFPVLKLLGLISCKWVEVKLVEIYAPSLHKVTSITPYEWDDKKDLDYSIKIIGTKVIKLSKSGGYPENISVADSTVAKASLQCTFIHPLLSLEECGLQARKVLKELPNLTCLAIFDLRAIGQTELSLPRFRELKKLHLSMTFDAKGFLKLLHATPNLNYLEIVLTDGEYGYEYDSVEPLPSCVVRHLEQLKFDYNECYWVKSYLVEKFLLKNCAQLKTVFISARRKFLDSIETDLSRFPRASPCINISWLI